ncbi:VIT1/CCC1 transporter family protein [Pediococcus cellicola]|nr:VIT family protein [Pediococcus cellicola]
MDNWLNTLRAGVLGANDGILTVVGVLFSVAAATTNSFTIFIAGLSDLLACAFSMSAGEFASVSSQRDTEKAVVGQERLLLNTKFADEKDHVVKFYEAKGVHQQTAQAIADELLAQKDRALATVVSVKYDMNLKSYLNPWQAALSSLVSAASGGIFPLLAMTFAPAGMQLLATILAVLVAVALTGYMSARLGNGLPKKAMIRNIIVGIITMFIHYYVGKLF